MNTLSSKDWFCRVQRIPVGRCCALAALVLCACTHQPEQAAATPVTEPARPAPVASPTAQDTRGSLVATERLKAKCNLPDAPTERPQFDYDEEALRPRGTSILDAVATCMLEGSMKDERLTLTGHADPRGSDEYNRDLGMRRADAARDYLVSRVFPPHGSRHTRAERKTPRVRIQLPGSSIATSKSTRGAPQPMSAFPRPLAEPYEVRQPGRLVRGRPGLLSSCRYCTVTGSSNWFARLAKYSTAFVASVLVS